MRLLRKIFFHFIGFYKRKNERAGLLYIYGKRGQPHGLLIVQVGPHELGTAVSTMKLASN
jgi:hypothetical protein